MITRKFSSDFSQLPSKTFNVTLVAPNKDEVQYPGLTGEQTEQLWRLWQAAEDAGWDFTWTGSTANVITEPS